MKISSWRKPLPCIARMMKTVTPVRAADHSIGIPVRSVMPIAAPRTSARSVAIAVPSWVIHRM
jgi:hypothetical protein